VVKNAGKSSDFRTWYQFFHPQAECCVEFSGKRFRISKSELVFSQPLYLRLYKVVQRLTENQVRFRNPESFSRKPSAMSAETVTSCQCTFLPWDQIPRLGLAPATLESRFWVRFPGPNERKQGKQAHPVLKYRVPHGSQYVMGRLVH